MDRPRALPTPIRVRGVIDTGAEMSTITPTVAGRLDFDQPLRIVPLAGANSTQLANVYAVQMHVGPLDASSGPIATSVVVASLVDAEHDCLIGRAVLSRGELHRNGRDSTYGLVLPD